MRTLGKLPLPHFCLKDTSLLEAFANIKEKNYSASLHKDSSLSHFAGEKHVFQHLSFQCVLPSTSCICSFGEKSSVSVGTAPCFASDHTEEAELEQSGLIRSWVGCAGREQLGRRSIFHS